MSYSWVRVEIKVKARVLIMILVTVLGSIGRQNGRISITHLQKDA